MIFDTLSPKPLFDWFSENKANRAKLRAVGYSDGRITNWKRRGIPRAEVGNLASLMGWTYERYVSEAETAERRSKTWRRAAAFALVFLLPLGTPQQAESSQSTGVVYYVKRRCKEILTGLWFLRDLSQGNPSLATTR